MNIKPLLSDLANANQAYKDAEELLERSRKALLGTRDTMVDSFADALLKDPVGTLEGVSYKDLRTVLWLAYIADQSRIYSSPNPSNLPGANDTYCYRFPDSPTSRLLEAFSESVEELGFSFTFTHFLTQRYRGSQHKMGSANITIRDTEQTRFHRHLFQKMIEASKILHNTVSLRVRISQEEIIAEYHLTKWYMYENGIEILHESIPTHYTSFDGLHDPFEFMQTEVQRIQETGEVS